MNKLYLELNKLVYTYTLESLHHMSQTMCDMKENVAYTEHRVALTEMIMIITELRSIIYSLSGKPFDMTYNKLREVAKILNEND